MILLTLILSLFVGVSLGLLGGGGSVLTVPILVYVAGLPAATAIPMSLLVVGLTSVFGAFLYGRLGLVRPRTAAAFGASGVVGALGGARLTPLVSSAWLLRLFAVLMLVVATAMLFQRHERPVLVGGDTRRSLGQMLLAGLGVGVLTGFLGVGGGFVILPVLLWIGRVPLKEAIGTSLIVIAMSSFAGFLGHLGSMALDWRLTGEVTLCAAAGMLVGHLGARKAHPGWLRVGFAGLILATGVTMLLTTLDGGWFGGGLLERLVR